MLLADASASIALTNATGTRTHYLSEHIRATAGYHARAAKKRIIPEDAHEELFRPDGARAAGSRDHARRRGQSHLRRLRREPARSLPGHRETVWRHGRRRE